MSNKTGLAFAFGILAAAAAAFALSSPAAQAEPPPGEALVYLNAGRGDYTVVLGPLETVVVARVEFRGEDLRVDQVGKIVTGTVEEDTLVVERVRGEARKYWLRDSGIRCIVDPCPSVELVDLDGNVLEAAGIDLAERLDGDGVMTRLLQAPRGARVRGYLAEGPWSPPHSSGNVVHVTGFEIVGPEVGACWGAWRDHARNCRTPTDRFYPAQCCR